MSKRIKILKCVLKKKKPNTMEQMFLMNKLFIGKKEIGRVIPQNDKKIHH